MNDDFINFNIENTFDIICDGSVVFTNVPVDNVDSVCLDLASKFNKIEVKEFYNYYF